MQVESLSASNDASFSEWLWGRGGRYRLLKAGLSREQKGDFGVVSALVSVIIPAYNRVKYIQQAVDSVLKQTYRSVELIVVDDGSTDGTFDLLQGYGDRILLIHHERRVNRGQSASINLGLTKAKGKYIAILDSDDYWELNKLEVQVTFLEANPDVGLVYTNGYCVDAEGHRLYAYHSRDHVEHNDPNLVLLDCYMALPVNSLVRKAVYDEVGFFEESFRAAQDHDMLIRMAEVTKFAYLPDYLFYYRRHQDSISKKKLDVRWKTGFEILRRAQQRYPYRVATIRKRKAVLNYRLAVEYLKNGHYVTAFSRFATAGLLDPMRSTRVLLGIEKKD